MQPCQLPARVFPAAGGLPLPVPQAGGFLFQLRPPLGAALHFFPLGLGLLAHAVYSLLILSNLPFQLPGTFRQCGNFLPQPGLYPLGVPLAGFQLGQGGGQSIPVLLGGKLLHPQPLDRLVNLLAAVQPLLAVAGQLPALFVPGGSLGLQAGQSLLAGGFGLGQFL